MLLTFIIFLVSKATQIIKMDKEKQQQKKQEKKQKQQNKQQNKQQKAQPSNTNTSTNNNNNPTNNNNAHQQQQEQWQSMSSQQNEQQYNQLQQILQNAVNQLNQHQQSSSAIQAQVQASNQQGQWQQQSQSVSKKQQQQQQFSFGCQHYKRNCLVQAPCCKIFYSCKLCHDDKYQGPKSQGCKVQRMAFSQVKNIKCLKCSKIQQPSIKCRNPECQITFGKYCCLKCKLYENKPQKVNDIFHCDQCQMCRRGKQQLFFHCKKCGYCRSISQKDKHKCTQNVAQSQCPVCLQILKYSTKYYQSLPCGHLIHLQCLQMYNSINCPICGMAVHKLSASRNKRMDEIIQQTRPNLPKQVLDKKVDILCNQCLHKSMQQPFHFLGIKCQGCGTYNTKMI